jgi:hypothetical protein
MTPPLLAMKLLMLYTGKATRNTAGQSSAHAAHPESASISISKLIRTLSPHQHACNLTRRPVQAVDCGDVNILRTPCQPVLRLNVQRPQALKLRAFVAAPVRRLHGCLSSHQRNRHVVLKRRGYAGGE